MPPNFSSKLLLVRESVGPNFEETFKPGLLYEIILILKHQADEREHVYRRHVGCCCQFALPSLDECESSRKDALSSVQTYALYFP